MIQSDTETASAPSSQDGPEVAAKMDPALKANWVEALRSGEYEQARGALSDGNGFCCLGVLCKIRGLTIGADDNNSVIDDAGEDVGYTPITRLLGGAKYYELTERNDGSMSHKAHSFSQIADYIEANL